MDPELSQAFETLEQRIRQGVAGEIQASEARMRQGVAEEIQASEARMRQGVAGEIQASEARMRQYVDASAQETRRHSGVLAEGLRSDFRIATEAIMPLDRKVGALQAQGEHTVQRVDLLESRVTVLERSGKTRRRRQ